MICPIPLRDFAFSGSQKLKNILASQGRRHKAGVAKDLHLGGVYGLPPEARDVYKPLRPTAAEAFIIFLLCFFVWPR